MFNLYTMFDNADITGATGSSIGLEARNITNDKFIRINSSSIYVADKSVSEPVLIYALTTNNQDSLDLFRTLARKENNFICNRLKIFYAPRILKVRVNRTLIGNYTQEFSRLKKVAKNYKIMAMVNQEDRIKQDSVMIDMSYLYNLIKKNTIDKKYIMNKKTRQIILDLYKKEFEKYPSYNNKVIYVQAPVLNDTGIKLTIMENQLLKIFNPFILFLEWFYNEPEKFKEWLTKNNLTFVIENKNKKILALSGKKNFTKIEYFKPAQVLKYIHVLDGKTESEVIDMVKTYSEENQDAVAEDSKIYIESIGAGIMTDMDVYDNPSVPIDEDSDEDVNLALSGDAEIEDKSWSRDSDKSDILEDEDDIVDEDTKKNIVALNDELTEDLADIEMNESNVTTDDTIANKKEFFNIVDDKGKSQEDKVNDVLEIHNYSALKKSVETPKIKKLKENLMKSYGRNIHDIVKNVKTHQLDIKNFGLDEKSSYNVSRIANLGSSYRKKLAKADLENIILKPMEMSYPLLLKDKKETDISDRMFKGKKMDITYQTHNGEELSFSLDIPEVVDNKLFIGGSYKNIQLQNAPKPVTKTDEDVFINTGYNKSNITLRGRYPSLAGKEISMVIKKFSTLVPNAVKIKTTDDLGDFIYNNLVCYEFIHLNRQFNGVLTSNINVDFRGLGPYPKNKDLTLLGNIGEEEVIHNPETGVTTVGKTEYSPYEFIHMLFKAVDEEKWNESLKAVVGKVTTSGTYVPYAKIMGRDIPVILLLWIAMPLTDILKKLEKENNLRMKKIPLDSNGQHVKIKPKAGYGILELPDRTLILQYNNELNELLLNYLTSMDLTKYDSLDITSVMAELTGNSNTALYIENFIELFIDPDTARICQLYNIPDDFVGIFIYAVSLFTTHSTTYKSDSRNYRILTPDEVINRCIYDVISKEFSDNAARMKRGSRPRFNISRDAVIRRLQALPNMAEANPLSPLRVINNNSQISLKGHYGINMQRAFTMNTRAFNKNNFGTETMGTAYSGQAGITKYLPFNPVVSDLTGEYEHHDSPEGLNASNWSTFAESYVPYMSNDHIARVIMFNGQTNHPLPIEGADPMLVSTRADEAAIKMAPEFAYVAKGKGKITGVSDKFINIKYNDGTEDAISLENVVRNTDKGYFLKNDFELNPKFKLGSTINEDDVVAYSKYFYKKKANGQVGLSTGVLCWVLFCDSEATWEDSCLPFSDLADKLATKIVKRVARVIDLNTEIRDWRLDINANVTPEDILYKYKVLSDDESINELFAGAEELSLKEVDAHSKGRIIDIRAYYRVGKDSEISPSVKKFMRDLNDIQRTAQHMSDIDKVTDKFRKAQLDGRVQLLERDKYSKIDGDTIENGQILIEYFIETLDKLGPADKIVVDRALKGEPSVVLDKSLRPTGVDTGRKASLMSSSTGFLGRMTGGMALHGELLSVLLHTACFNRYLLNRPAEEGSLLDYKSNLEMIKNSKK